MMTTIHGILLSLIGLNVFLLRPWHYTFAYVVRTAGRSSKHRLLLHDRHHHGIRTTPTNKNLESYLKASSIDMDMNAELSSPSSSSSSSSSSGMLSLDDLLDIPRHETNEGVNEILSETERMIRSMHHEMSEDTTNSVIVGDDSNHHHHHPNGEIIDMTTPKRRRSLTSKYGMVGESQQQSSQEEDTATTTAATTSSTTAAKGPTPNEVIYANTYVDFGKVDTIGFDYDYTLVTYTTELLELLYDMALSRLVKDRHYPLEMLSAGLVYDPYFSVRGLAVDKENGWICHLSYTHKVAVAWEGREKMPTSAIYKEYRGKRALTPTERKQRLKPLNDLFSMAESCLLADTIQFFKDQEIDFCPSNVVNDILGTIRDTHISGDFHRIVAANPQLYFNPTEHLKPMLTQLKDSGKRLIFASNSPFWYVDAGMNYVLGENWRDIWDAIIVSAGKPAFYTETRRPFREVNTETNRLRFQKVETLDRGKVYTEGCLQELTRLMKQQDHRTMTTNGNVENEAGETEAALKTSQYMGALNMNSNVLYVGDSLFADLVDAKREYGWITAAVVPEVGFEMEIQQETEFVLIEKTIECILNALRLVQTQMGSMERTQEDSRVLDALERLVSKWRDKETELLGNPFGSVFRARYQPSLFAHSLRRYCDLYMNSVGSLRLYSPQHRFYPEPAFRLLAHEISRSNKGDYWEM